LWTPLLTPFAQMDMLGPKGLGFLLYGERVERGGGEPDGTHASSKDGLGRVCLVGPLLFNLDGL